jgi:hypothetical protein
MPPEARLFAITGFPGGLTKFPTFFAETVTLMLREQYYRGHHHLHASRRFARNDPSRHHDYQMASAALENPCHAI